MKPKQRENIEYGLWSPLWSKDMFMMVERMVERIYEDDQMVIFIVEFFLLVNFKLWDLYICENPIRHSNGRQMNTYWKVRKNVAVYMKKAGKMKV